jgi:hypothetical protein
MEDTGNRHTNRQYSVGSAASGHVLQIIAHVRGNRYKVRACRVSAESYKCRHENEHSALKVVSVADIPGIPPANIGGQIIA